MTWVSETPLHLAAFEGSPSEVASLLDQGADIQSKATFELDGLVWPDVSPLHVAAMNADPAVAALLLDRGANIEAIDGLGATPLHIASHFGSTLAVQLFVDRGANVNSETNTGATPLHLAAGGHTPTAASVRILVENGANIEAAAADGSTPLHGAIAWTEGLPPTVELLLFLGADIETRNNFGQTALQVAVVRGKPTTLIQLLLEGGADIEAPGGTNGWTTLHMAVHIMRRDNEDTLSNVYLLLAHGANIDARDRYNTTPCELLNPSFSEDEIRYLLCSGLTS